MSESQIKGRRARASPNSYTTPRWKTHPDEYIQYPPSALSRIGRATGDIITHIRVRTGNKWIQPSELTKTPRNRAYGAPSPSPSLIKYLDKKYSPPSTPGDTPSLTRREKNGERGITVNDSATYVNYSRAYWERFNQKQKKEYEKRGMKGPDNWYNDEKNLQSINIEEITTITTSPPGSAYFTSELHNPRRSSSVSVGERPHGHIRRNTPLIHLIDNVSNHLDQTKAKVIRRFETRGGIQYTKREEVVACKTKEGCTLTLASLGSAIEEIEPEVYDVARDWLNDEVHAFEVIEEGVTRGMGEYRVTMEEHFGETYKDWEAKFGNTPEIGSFGFTKRTPIQPTQPLMLGELLSAFDTDSLDGRRTKAVEIVNESRLKHSKSVGNMLKQGCQKLHLMRRDTW